MHAVVVNVTIHDFEGGQQMLSEEVVPRVQQAPGFVTGYWTRSEDNRGLSMMVFESEDAANGAAHFERRWTAPSASPTTRRCRPPYGSALGGQPFAGEDVDDTAVLVKFTWFADLNLDGLIGFGDLSVFNTNYDHGVSTGRLWTEGDFTFHGLIDFQDLSVFYTNYDSNKPQL